ncbi:chromosomal replication initiator protein DnaA [Johnsonella ignava ATCC 51276]|jgi:chromosomal replication initiator protein dnaA|uniref:Chromosomal replication initiator protein DnaA n=1 Tax=Johnsonella ignava ATCC 51276 TaxID=679200 RepID=G5GKD4_9FIRM|nr:chromosomal replication initiator protein DnaA [Johnsonella ignava]EHI54824.1 chromosomal replication initiator protein DnaA [Johnsonella ignava ATCC 51276]
MNEKLETIKSRWEDIIKFLKEEHELTNVSYNTWIVPLKPYSLIKNDDGNYVLHLVAREEKTPFINFVQGKYSLFLSVAVEEITGIKCEIIIDTEESIPKPHEHNKLINSKAYINSSKLATANLNEKYKFNTFVVGKNNNIAHAASLAVAESPGEIYNPLFIYGGVGLGKTHLMHSVAHFILEEKNSDARVLYVTSETFTNELIESIRNVNNSTADFRNKYRNIDVLLIDDIQFIIGKESTQEEFFHTFNALTGAKKQVIISSDRPPKDFVTLEERLKSRFESGLSVDIQPPDYETRMAILHKKEELENISIDDAVVQYIAANVKSNIRELEGALNRMVAMGRLGKIDVTLELAQETLKDIINPNVPVLITPEHIAKVVAEHYHISLEDIKSKKKTYDIAYPRQIAMYLCRKMTSVQLKSIGQMLGGRDHSTVIHGYEKIKNDLKYNPDLSATINIITKKLNPQ